MSSIFDKRTSYKPFNYPWAYEGWLTSEKAHWMTKEVPLGDDVRDWKTILNSGEKKLLTQIFRFFTQADCDVAVGYVERYLPQFKQIEIRMMLLSIAARECVHIDAYSKLIEELGLPEVEYSAFLEYNEMKEKHDYMFQQRDGLEGLAQDMAVFSAFGEGLQLFSSFVILLNFTRFGKMKGMGQLVTWSIRDESHHVDCMIKLYKTLLDENPTIWTDRFKSKLYATCEYMVGMEDKFIDLAYQEAGDIEGLTPEEVKQYIRYIANKRLGQLDLKPMFSEQMVNPLPWVDSIVNGKEHTNFFENKPTVYTKASVTGNWNEAFD